MTHHDPAATMTASPEPIVRASTAYLIGLLVAVAVAVWAGPGVSGLLAGHGWSPTHGGDLLGWALAPRDPASAWTTRPSPGPAWLLYGCVAALLAAQVAVLTVAGLWLAGRGGTRRSGLAGPTVLRASGLSARAAARRSCAEFPILTAVASDPAPRETP